jgi:uncharacterized membrane protein YphA (DoxX/SURF4 family)
VQSLVDFIRDIYARATKALNWLQSPLLLAIRLYWGWQFAQDGYGKLTHLEKVTQYFTTLNLPMPGQTAFAVALSWSAAYCSPLVSVRASFRWSSSPT